LDLSKPAQKIVTDDQGRQSVGTSGARLIEAQVRDRQGHWVAIEPQRSYRVLTSSFLVDQAGDGYFWFKQHGQNLNNTYTTFYSIMAEAVGRDGTLSPRQPDGRLKIVQ
jgi:hypothetical protein